MSMLRYGAHLIILYIETAHKIYVKSTQVDGIKNPLPKENKNMGTFYKYSPPPPSNSGSDKNCESQ